MRAFEYPQWRVLLVPDSIYWVTGTICREIARNNPWIRPTICSTRVLRRILQRDAGIIERIDLVHFLDPWAPKLLLEKLLPQVPCIGSIHHMSPRVVEANSAADIVTVGSRQWFDYLILRGEVPEDRLVLTPYGVNATLFRAVTPRRRDRCRRRLRIARESFVIGFFGKESSDASQRKGIDVLLAGLHKIKTRVSNIVAVIVGPGWGRMVEHLRTAGIDCRWTPYVSDYARMVDVYHALDVYWVTARVEGGPLTLLEAMSCGICCVTTPVGVAQEIAVDGVNACVVPVGDVDSLVQKTEILARNAALRETIGRAATAVIRESRGWEKTTRGIQDLYTRAAVCFRQRTGKRIEPQPSKPPSRRSRSKRNEYPLLAVDPSLRRWARMLEILYWLNNGDFGDSPHMARRLSWRACRINPWSREPWAHLLRTACPEIYRHLSRRFG